MSAIQGKCHCGAVEYTAKLGDKSHILWCGLAIVIVLYWPCKVS